MNLGSPRRRECFRGENKRGKRRGKERLWGGAANHVLTSLTLRVNDAECAEAIAALVREAGGRGFSLHSLHSRRRIRHSYPR
jgi:hypothetical protein